MRGLGAFLLVGILTGCEENRTFDERFDETANHIQERAANLDAEAREASASSTTEEGRAKAP